MKTLTCRGVHVFHMRRLCGACVSPKKSALQGTSRVLSRDSPTPTEHVGGCLSGRCAETVATTQCTKHSDGTRRALDVLDPRARVQTIQDRTSVSVICSS